MAGDDDEYDPPEPSRAIMVDRANPLDLSAKMAELRESGDMGGYTHVMDLDGNMMFRISLPTKRMRTITTADAVWMDLGEVLEDVAIAFRNKVTREEFLKAVEGALSKIIKWKQ